MDFIERWTAKSRPADICRCFFCLSHTSTLHFVSSREEDAWSIWTFSPSCREFLDLCLALSLNKPQKSSWAGRTLYSGRCQHFPSLSNKGKEQIKAEIALWNPFVIFESDPKVTEVNGNLCWFLWYPDHVSKEKAAKYTTRPHSWKPLTICMVDPCLVHAQCEDVVEATGMCSSLGSGNSLLLNFQRQ